MREPKTPMPLFYYSGSKKHGIKSDKVGIEFHLLRIPEHLREAACRKYDDLYTANLYGKYPNDRRSVANGWLVNYCDENGVSVERVRDRLRGTNVSKENQAKASSLVEKIKLSAMGGRKSII